MAKILGAIAWVLLAWFVLGATFVLLGITFALVILHSGPSTEAAILGGVLVALAGLLCWLVARFFTSGRTVRRAVAIW
jgi:hypothetical protein